ncbi:hypothetical protein BHM03_00060630 [Ensete ventricosum]|nr:hypothetical protein BHM03_00060630 [Ensete ventricosum]
MQRGDRLRPGPLQRAVVRGGQQPPAGTIGYSHGPLQGSTARGGSSHSRARLAVARPQGATAHGAPTRGDRLRLALSPA